MEPKLEPKLATTYFHLRVDKVAQVVPNGAQSDSKGAQRLPKWNPNAAQGIQNMIPMLFQMGAFL